MQLRALLADEKAVSPVIGVILMVAITVILAAVIGTFVLGLGDQVQENPPQSSFTFDYDTLGDSDDTTGELDVTHDGGDKVEASEISFAVSGGDGSVTPGSWPASDVTAGDTNTVSGVGTSETVRVVWQAGQGNSGTLGKWTGPDA